MNILLMTHEEFIADYEYLCKAHWEELPNAHEEEELCIDPAGFEGCDVFVVEHEGTGLGYAVFRAVESPYTTSMVVQNVSLYLWPDVRSRGVGRALMEAVEAHYAEQFGECKVELQFKPHAIPDSFLKAAGYEISEVRYSKRIGDE